METLGERTVLIDCDVIQADGGTRTASITGSFVALVDALSGLANLDEIPITEYLAAVSVGKVNDKILLDLAYEEDSKAEVDMNVVMTESGRFVEVQGTAEGEPFSRQELDALLEIAGKGINDLIVVQKEALGELQKKFKVK